MNNDEPYKKKRWMRERESERWMFPEAVNVVNYFCVVGSPPAPLRQKKPQRVLTRRKLVPFPISGSGRSDDLRW